MDLTLSHLENAIEFFIYNFIELSVLFIVVSLFVEIINIFVNPKKVQNLLSSSKGGYLISSLLGSLTPFCSCSTIPLTLGLLKAKASFGPIMTFLFTSPLLNPIIIVVFFSSFGFKVTLIYGLIAFLVSILAGYILEKLGFEKYIKKEIFQKVSSFSTTAPKSCCSAIKINVNTEQNIKIDKIFNKYLFKKTWNQFLSFVPYIAIGIAIGAFVHGFVPQEFLVKYAGEDNLFAVPISALVGVPLYIRAESMVGLAPALLEKGVSMGSILSLTIAGAGASLPEMVMLKKIFKMPIMIFFILCVFIMAIGCGFLVNFYTLHGGKLFF